MEDRAGLSPALLGALALPVAAALATHGGFYPRGQVAFAVLAGASAIACAAIAGIRPGELRSPAVWLLAALAALAAVSALWTIGEPEAALRWGAVLAGYAALVMAAAVVVQRTGARPVAGLLAAIAVAAGLVGLYGAGARVEPLAQRLGGQWSAGGPFEYPPALALAQVSALPALLLAACADGRSWAAAGAFGLAVSGGVLALAGSRVEIGLGLTVVGLLLAFAQPSLVRDRRMLLAAAALTATAGGLTDAVAGSYARPFVTGDDLPRLLGLGGVLLGAPTLWMAQRRLLAGGARGSGVRVAVVAVPVAVALALAAATDDTGPRTEPVSGFSHGRVAQWESAIDAARERPLAGSGADSFLEASAEFQDPPPVRFAHNLPLEAWAELGLAGVGIVFGLYAYSAALAWSRRRTAAGWLLGPAVVAFLAANLFDWPWHVPASGALFAIALGSLASKPSPTSPR